MKQTNIDDLLASLINSERKEQQTIPAKKKKKNKVENVASNEENTHARINLKRKNHQGREECKAPILETDLMNDDLENVTKKKKKKKTKVANEDLELVEMSLSQVNNNKHKKKKNRKANDELIEANNEKHHIQKEKKKLDLYECADLNVKPKKAKTAKVIDNIQEDNAIIDSKLTAKKKKLKHNECLEDIHFEPQDDVPVCSEKKRKKSKKGKLFPDKSTNLDDNLAFESNVKKDSGKNEHSNSKIIVANKSLDKPNKTSPTKNKELEKQSPKEKYNKDNDKQKKSKIEEKITFPTKIQLFEVENKEAEYICSSANTNFQITPNISTIKDSPTKKHLNVGSDEQSPAFEDAETSASSLHSFTNDVYEDEDSDNGDKRMGKSRKVSKKERDQSTLSCGKLVNNLLEFEKNRIRMDVVEEALHGKLPKLNVIKKTFDNDSNKVLEYINSQSVKGKLSRHQASKYQKQDIISPSTKDVEGIPEVTSEQASLLETLSIELPFPVAPLHSIETRTNSPPTQKQKQSIKDSGLSVKMGIFVKEEDELILKNWKEFCKRYDVAADPLPFVYNVKTRKANMEKMKFVQFLGHGLNNRLLYTIFKRWKKLCLNLQIKHGRFTPHEDAIIVKYLKRQQGNTPFEDLSKILDRSNLAIKKRANKLIEKEKTTTIQWDKKSMEKFVKRLLKITKAGSVEKLENRKITSEEWKLLSNKFDGISTTKLRRAWLCTIHPKVFLKKAISSDVIKREIIEVLIDDKVDDWRSIKWNEIAKEFQGFTGEHLNKIFKEMIAYYVPRNITDDVQETLLYLKKNVIVSQTIEGNRPGRPTLHQKEILLPDDK